MSEKYHDTRFAVDPRRDVLWRALWKYYFRYRISPEDCVLDIGCGHGQFINNVIARRRLATDTWPTMPEYVADGVEARVGSATDLEWIEDGSVDFAFASNLFEHLTQDEFCTALRILRPKMSTNGSLTILQPNYRYAFREYFDDYTHLSIYSHVSISDFLSANAWDVIEIKPRFLPLTIKSKLPVWPALIAAYLRSPLKPFAKQMLVTAKPSRGE